MYKNKSKNKNKQKLGITSEEVMGTRKIRKSKWDRRKEAGQGRSKKMLGKALEIEAKALMKNNI